MTRPLRLLSAALCAALALAPVGAEAQKKKSKKPKAAAAAEAPAAEEAAEAAPSVSLAVLDFTLPAEFSAELARAMGEAAAAAATRVGGFQVISQGDIVAQLGLEQSKQLLGCTEDASCVAEIAGALNTDQLLSGAVALIEKTSVVTVKLIDVRKARTLRRTSENLREATQLELLDAARRLAHETLTGDKLDTTGVLRVEVDQPGATVVINGREVGRSPLAGNQRLPEGSHRITIQKPGFVRWETTVTLTAGATLPVTANLVPLAGVEGASSRAWTFGYVTAGIALAALTTGGIFGQLANQSYDKYRATSLRSEALALRSQTENQALIANVALGIGGLAAVGSGALFVTAVVSDASRAPAVRAPRSAAPAPDLTLAVSGRF